MTKWVTLAADINPSFDFLLPVGGLVWRKVTGYEPLCLLAGPNWDSPIGQLVVDQLNAFGMRHHLIGTLPEPYRTGVIAQMSRQHAACLDLPEDDLLMTGDADMIPINGEWFNRWDESKLVRLHYANSYSYNFHTTGYWTMRVKTWREVMRLDTSKSILDHLLERLDRWITRERDSWQEWYSDECVASAYLKLWPGYPSKCSMIEREGAPPVDRIDRSGWPDRPSFEGKVDAHVLRPSWTTDAWPRMRWFLERLIPDQMKEVDSFHKRYVEVRG